MPTAAISFHAVSRHFGEIRAVDDVSFEIIDGEFFTMLGPSGSGKTTCLRMIAGFDHPSAGQIRLFGQDVTDLPPYARDINTVFQNYALFPHMNVGENIGYGLMLKKVAKAERERRVSEMLELVRLPGYEKRKPSQLSGGQQQRVALARALINQPRVLLLDEPLGALDLKLRQQMQGELKGIQRDVGITFVFVTHDQEEAMTMSNRIAVFNGGRIEQIGTPADLYERPQTPFVATFVGISNLFEAEAAARITGQARPFSLRPERIHLAAPDAAVPAEMWCVDGTVEDVTYLGMNSRYRVRLDDGSTVTAIEQNREGGNDAFIAQPDQRVRLLWRKTANNPL